jgi:hypothetical protein
MDTVGCAEGVLAEAVRGGLEALSHRGINYPAYGKNNYSELLSL